ncbi:MAG: 2-oxo acid dehydrogenase subunit E2 [Candidatus Aminicenantes bacterium]|nr:2-oxo acid dehydrogenase subunit E2 [Candidatus Aminicenantes bacterium]
MRFIFKFPDIGEGISEGKILNWYIKKGRQVKSGEAIVKMETDKVVTDIPSPHDGVIAAIFGNEGDVINVGDPLVEIEIEGAEGKIAQKIAKEEPEAMSKETVDEKSFGVVGSLEVAGDAARLPAGDEGLPPKPEEVPRRKALATPVARAMAGDLNIDIGKVRGTGPAGRVMKQDIRDYYENLQKGELKVTPAAAAAQPGVLPVEYTPLTQIRKTIARNMSRSKQNAAHMTVFEDVEVSELVKLRAKYKEQFSQAGLKFSYMPFILKAVAAALTHHPDLNSELDLENNRLIYKKYYHIGIAVDTDNGLVVPVVRDVDKRSIRDLTAGIAALAEKARERKLSLEDFKDGTFTVTNYGSIAGTYGVPVINYPQAAILGSGRIMKVPLVKGDEIVIGQVLPLSMSVDHRIVDGGAAARFILEVKAYLQDPVSLFLE